MFQVSGYSTAGGAAIGRPVARSGRDPLGDGWSEHDRAVAVTGPARTVLL